VIVGYRERWPPPRNWWGELGPKKTVAVGADLTTEERAQELAAQAVSAFGRIDILVNNMGLIVREKDWTSSPKNRASAGRAAAPAEPALWPAGDCGQWSGGRGGCLAGSGVWSGDAAECDFEPSASSSRTW
jgi:short chain dehydrogenase